MSDVQNGPAEPRSPATADGNRPVDAQGFKRDLAEVRMLIEFISGRPDKDLSESSIPNPDDRNNKLLAEEVLRRIAGMPTDLQPSEVPPRPPVANDSMLLLLAKDRLTKLARPARGLTIAYTGMVIGSTPLLWLTEKAVLCGLGLGLLTAGFVLESDRKILTVTLALAGLAILAWLFLPALLRYVQRLRGRGGNNRGAGGGGGDDGGSYLRYAREAFPGLERNVPFFKAYIYLLIAFVGGWLFLTALAYWDVALGNSVLKRIDPLNQELKKIVLAHPGAETRCAAKIRPASGSAKEPGSGKDSGPGKGSAPVKESGQAQEPAYTVVPPLATRSRVITDTGTSAGRLIDISPLWTLPAIVLSAEPEAGARPGPNGGDSNPPPAAADPNASNPDGECLRIWSIRSDKRRAHDDLVKLLKCESPDCHPHLLRWGFLLCGYNPGKDFNVYERADSAAAPAPDEAAKIDGEDQSIASVFSVFSSYILPMMFGLLGTAIGAVRELQQRIADGELAPRDGMMTMIGLAVGSVAGLVVGFIFSPDTPVSVDAGLAGKLSLSPVALGFLAGYASRSFFAFIDSVMKNVFPAESAARKAHVDQ